MNLVTPSIELVEENNDNYLHSFIEENEISVQDEISSHLLFSNKDKNPYMLCSSVGEFEELLSQHEVDSYTKYTIYKTNGPFKGIGKDPVRKPRVHWGVLSKVSPSLASTPYLIVGTRYYVCHLGKCYYTAKLQKYSTQRDEDNKKRYKKVTGSKKVGCPANFKVQRLIVFPDNKLPWDTPSERARMGDYIRKNISKVRIEHKYLFKFPDFSDHENHMQQHIAAGKEPIDKRVVEKIRELVYSGKTNVHTVRELLEEFVENEIKVSDKTRRRFYPPKVDIQRTIYKAKLNLRRSKNDQDKIVDMKASLGSSTEVYFQPSAYDVQGFSGGQWNLDVHNCLPRKSGLLFVFQNAEMRRLYELYGYEGVILDPTFKFCLFSFPLYFLAVQTNVNYQIVAFFITEFETKEAIVDALSVIAHWNPTVIPKYAMTDNTSDEMKALEIVFPEIKVFIASSYCEASWEQRFMRRDMSGINCAEALSKLRAIQNAVSEDKAQKAINELKAWNQPILKEHFEKRWQKEIKKWTLAYRPPDFLCEANDAVNRLDVEFKYILLSRMKDLSLSQMIDNMCNNILPKTLHQYRALNQSILRRHTSLDSYIPSYLLESPQWILDLVVERVMLADQALSHSYVEYLSDGYYSLLSKKSNNKYNLKFDAEQKQVSCTCFYYLKRKVICKHAMIVGRFYPSSNIEKVSSWVFDNPIFKVDKANLDTSCPNLIKREGECRIQLDAELDTICIDNVERGSMSEVPRVSSFTDPSLARERERYKHLLANVDTLMHSMNASHLETLNEDLQEVCSKWSALPTSKSKQKVALPGQENGDIPFPFLKKISDFYANMERQQPTTPRKDKRLRKRKRNLKRAEKEKSFRRNKKRLNRIIDKEDATDLQTCNITTYCKVEKSDLTIPLYTVKIEGEEPSDPVEELESNKEVIEEYFYEENNIVIHINNPENEVSETSQL